MAGAVWPGATVFPDFLHNRSLEYWTAQLKGFHDTMPIDGAWIDMVRHTSTSLVSRKGKAVRQFIF